MVSLSVSGEVITWDRKKGSIADSYQIDRGDITDYSSLFSDETPVIFSYGFQGEFFASDYVK